MVKEPAQAVDSFQRAFAMATRTDNEIRELSPEEWDQLVDEKARKYLGMSGAEFERRLNAGETLVQAIEPDFEAAEQPIDVEGGRNDRPGA